VRKEKSFTAFQQAYIILSDSCYSSITTTLYILLSVNSIDGSFHSMSISQGYASYLSSRVSIKMHDTTNLSFHMPCHMSLYRWLRAWRLASAASGCA
jgi:hypothetical protein